MADTIWQLRVRGGRSKEVLEAADHDFAIRVSTLIMVVKNSKQLMFFSKLKYRGFEVADYDLATRLSKFKLADSI